MAYLLARLMRRRGRRIGQVTGLCSAPPARAIAVVAGVIGSMRCCWSAPCARLTSAANAAARYAATDLAPAGSRARALSLVVWATTVGAVARAQPGGPGGALADWPGIPELTGPFAIAAIGMLLAAGGVRGLHAPRPAAPRPHLGGRRRDAADGDLVGTGGGRPARQSALAAAVLGLASAHAVMVSVMIMTPLHMEHGGAPLEIIGFVISIHVLGMFAFSPVMGWLADRFGRPRCSVVGAVILWSALRARRLSPEGAPGGS